MKENKLADLSMELALDVLKITENIKGHYALTNQVERAVTSIGANIREANYAHSTADFISKFQISLKECYETEYWLELFVKAGYVEREKVRHVYNMCGTIRRMLVKSINTARENEEKKGL